MQCLVILNAECPLWPLQNVVVVVPSHCALPGCMESRLSPPEGRA